MRYYIYYPKSEKLISTNILPIIGATSDILVFVKINLFQVDELFVPINYSSIRIMYSIYEQCVAGKNIGIINALMHLDEPIDFSNETQILPYISFDDFIEICLRKKVIHGINTYLSITYDLERYVFILYDYDTLEEIDVDINVQDIDRLISITNFISIFDKRYNAYYIYDIDKFKLLLSNINYIDISDMRSEPIIENLQIDHLISNHIISMLDLYSIIKNRRIYRDSELILITITIGINNSEISKQVNLEIDDVIDIILSMILEFYS